MLGLWLYNQLDTKPNGTQTILTIDSVTSKQETFIHEKEKEHTKIIYETKLDSGRIVNLPFTALPATADSLTNEIRHLRNTYESSNP